MKPLKEKISITVDTDVLKEIRVQSEFYERSLSQFITIILRDYLSGRGDDYELHDVLRGNIHKSGQIMKIKEGIEEED